MNQEKIEIKKKDNKLNIKKNNSSIPSTKMNSPINLTRQPSNTLSYNHSTGVCSDGDQPLYKRSEVQSRHRAPHVVGVLCNKTKPARNATTLQAKQSTKSQAKYESINFVDQSTTLLFNISKKKPLYKYSRDSNIYGKNFDAKSLKEKFINLLMIDGKKTKASTLLNSTLFLMRKKILINKKMKENLSVLLENNRTHIKKINQYSDFSKKRNHCTSEAKYEQNKLSQVIQNLVPKRYIKYNRNKKINSIFSRDNLLTKDKISNLHLKNCTNEVISGMVNSVYPLSTKQAKYEKKQYKNSNHCTSEAKYEKIVTTAFDPRSGSPLRFSIKFIVTKEFLKSLKSIKERLPSIDLILKNSIDNIKPSIEVRKVRIAGTTYQVPAIISKSRQETLAIRWVIYFARKRKQNSRNDFSESLAQELIDALNKQGNVRQKRDELHKIAEANRAYSRYRWW